MYMYSEGVLNFLIMILKNKDTETFKILNFD